MACNADAGNLKRKALPPEHVLLERDIYPLAEAIGLKWKDLGRELDYKEHVLEAIENQKQRVAKECCIEVMVGWLRREGRYATAGKLAEALNNIQLKREAEELIGSLLGKQTLGLDIKELDGTNQSRWYLAQDRNGGNKYLIRKCTQEEYCSFQEFLDLKEKLPTLTENLARDDVKEDKESIAKRLELYEMLASKLHKGYSCAKTSSPRFAQCVRTLKEEFNESIMDGLRTIYNDLASRVSDLENSEGDMSEKEKEQFKRVREDQRRLDTQVVVNTEKFVESTFNLPPRILLHCESEPPKESSKAKDELAPRSSSDATRPKSHEIQKNKRCLEGIEVAAHEMITTEQRRQESLKHTSSEVEELKELRRVKLDCTVLDSSDGAARVQSDKQSAESPIDGKGLQDELETRLKSCESQQEFWQAMYAALIKLVGEAGQPKEDNCKCLKQLFDFTKELHDQKNKLFPIIEQLQKQKQQLDKPQCTRLEELKKWQRTNTQQLDGLERLLSTLLNQGRRKETVMKRRSEPLLSMKLPSSDGFWRRK